MASSALSGLTPGWRRAIFLTLALALMLTSVDQTIVASALTPIQFDLDTGIEWSTWTITIYALGTVIVMPLAGRLADVLGSRRVFITAAVLFTAASIGCGVAGNIYVLVAFRAAQAIGGGAFLPAASGIVVNLFGGNRDRALGLFATAFPLGCIIGPVLGGLIVGVATWRDIFLLVTAPVGVVVVILSILLIPDIRGVNTDRIDILGTLLLGLTLFGGMLGITLLGDPSISPLDPRFLVPGLVSLASLVLFVWRINVARSPFVRKHLLWGRRFGVINLLNFAFGAAALGVSTLVPYYAQEAFGMPALESGGLLSARAIGMISVSALATFALRRTGYRWPMAVGFVLVCVGALGTALVPGSASVYLWLFLATAIGGIGTGLSVPAANNAALQLEPDNAAGIAGLRGMFRQSGSILFVAVASALAARSADAGTALATSFIVIGVVFACLIPLVALVPEHRGSW